TQFDLGQNRTDVVLVGGRDDPGSGVLHGSGRGGPAGDLLGAQGNGHVVDCQIFQVGDLGGVALGDGDLKGVDGKEHTVGVVVVGPLLVHATFFHHLGHGVGVCGGEHVGGCAGVDLYGQLTGACEIEGHLDDGMLSLVLLIEFFEYVQKGCCGKDDVFSVGVVLSLSGLPCRTSCGH